MYYPIIETPMIFPIPNVTAAAANPKITCLKPENQTFFPVNNVIAAPIMNKPKPLAIVLNNIAV